MFGKQVVKKEWEEYPPNMCAPVFDKILKKIFIIVYPCGIVLNAFAERGIS